MGEGRADRWEEGGGDIGGNGDAGEERNLLTPCCNMPLIIPLAGAGQSSSAVAAALP